MRIGELSRRSGVPIPTIKFYMREGLVSQGERTGPNQAQYDEDHLRRIKLVRALVEAGGLSIAAAREVLVLMDSQVTDLGVLGKAQYALTPRKEEPAEPDEAGRWAAGRVEELIDGRGWAVKPTNPARRTLADALAALHRLGQEDFAPILREYAEVAERLAAVEVEAILRRPDPAAMAEAVVVWTAVGDTVLGSLRRLAQEAESARRLGPAEG
ncbi:MULTISPECIES: MerR family transcriptional regulator [Streptosporangium]|uniref:DNA-binding transcriptional MerR regulator n=1 Tax=Streptosporangium brasiliense TaxID=47480 RepID=A0ABT9RKV6_9ACTN|nr:MerR family transcriptional regulator [Streptosporangium brasiliense]MDP9869924.1 DNA-binding transcriptional MerR regulator [Streptosporangium brasiliense]